MSSNKDHNSRWPAPGLTHVPEYQLSGLPFCQTKTVAAGKTSFTFPKVTRWITISSAAIVNIYFSAGSGDAIIGEKFFTVHPHTLTRFELRCAKIYVDNGDTNDSLSKVSVMAGLTHIDSSNSVSESQLEWNV